MNGFTNTSTFRGYLSFSGGRASSVEQNQANMETCQTGGGEAETETMNLTISLRPRVRVHIMVQLSITEPSNTSP
jgi:hypothetical protein